MSAKQSAKNLPSLEEGKSPVDPCSGHIRISALCNVLTTAAVLKNCVFTNIHYHLNLMSVCPCIVGYRKGKTN
jgi:hypothetical protein